MSLQHEHTLHPISAIQFYARDSGQLLVLVGEGTHLKVFDAKTSRLLHQCKVFEGQTIHGIAVQDDITHDDHLQVVIWGGSSFTLLKKKHLEQKVFAHRRSRLTSAAREAPDWILDVAISASGESCVFVTAHNAVFQMKLNSRAPPKELSSPARSILYSAHLIWESDSQILVAAGTVFGEIIVWRCTISTDGSDSHILFTFTGHEGSIFGVNISPPISRPDGTNGRLLASCSDDRTIRVWDLGSKSASKLEVEEIVPRETGFGETESRAEHTGIGKPLATVMGHASRIWRVKFLVFNLGEREVPSITILSFGEDSTTQQWQLNLGSGISDSNVSHNAILISRPSLTHQNTFAFHTGKHIWSAACHQSSPREAVIATGGADGKVSLYEVNGTSSTNSLESPNAPADAVTNLRKHQITSALYTPDSFDVNDVLEPFSRRQARYIQPVLPPPPITKQETPKRTQKDTFNRYGFVSENRFLFTTTFGRIAYGDVSDKIKWTELSLPYGRGEELKSYSVVQGFQDKGVAIAVGANGNIYDHQVGYPLFRMAYVEPKVAGMFRITDLESELPEVIATTLGSTIATLFVIRMFPPRTTPGIKYTLPDKFIVTSAGKTNGLLILGSRNGSLAVYHPLNLTAPLTIWRAPHYITDAITTILPLSTQQPFQTTDSSYFLTTSRDGQYFVFSCVANFDGGGELQNVSIRPVHQGTPPLGPMIEQAWFQNGDLILYGFKGKNFVVWNETKQYEIESIECGGSHRSYAYSPFKEGGGNGHFIYTKASKLYVHTQSRPSHRIIKQGGHGREIKACAVSPNYELVATGAEDTAIRIWRYNDTLPGLEKGLQCQAVIQKHTTGIQHLQWHGTNYLFSSGGNEEFFVWAVEDIPGFGVGIVCEASNPDQSDEQDLRIMSFDVCDHPGEEGKLVISLAFSDSTIKVYSYSKDDGLRLLADGRHTSACLTQIRHIQMSAEEGYILTGSTDGKLVIWKLLLKQQGESADAPTLSDTKRLFIVSETVVHQSSIKSLDIAIRNDFLLIISGGDDNALQATIYPSKYPFESLTNPQSFSYPSAHAAAITGLCILTPGEAPKSIPAKNKLYFRIVTSSNDQRVKYKLLSVKVGEMDETEGKFEVELKETSDEFTPVADVGGVVTLRAGTQDEVRKSEGMKVLIVGNGMEVWRIKD